MGGNKLFVDTNVLVYAVVIESPFHVVARAALSTYERLGWESWISRQVMREFITTFTRPHAFLNPIALTMLTAMVRSFETRFQIAEDNAQVTNHLLSLIEQIPMGGKLIHDANIVATMQAYGINHLLTHNLKDFVRF